MFNYKKIMLLLTLSSSLYATDEISVDLRALYVNYNYDNYFKNSEAFATSLKLGYKKNIFSNLEVGTTFGAIEEFGLNDMNKQAMTYIHSNVYTGDSRDTFTILHQAYLKYYNENNYLQIGRFEFNSPLINSDDHYLLSNSFEGAIAKLVFDSSSVQFGHISRMSGTWDAGYDGSTFQSMSKSPWMHKADVGENNWPNPYVSFGVENNGISFVSYSYNDDKYKFQLWDYYAKELMNSIYTQFDMKLDSFNFALQYNSFDAVGQMKDHPSVNSEIDYKIFGAKIDTKIEDVNIALAYMGVSDDETAHLWGSWGGYPYFASGMMITYFDASLRDANVYSLNSNFSLMSCLDTTLHLGYYDLNKEYTKRDSANAPNGEDYMFTYGVSNTYSFNDNLSFVIKLAGRKLDSENEALLLRSILKYKF